jgi:hypothetical protein
MFQVWLSDAAADGGVILIPAVGRASPCRNMKARLQGGDRTLARKRKAGRKKTTTPRTINNSEKRLSRAAVVCGKLRP